MKKNPTLFSWKPTGFSGSGYITHEYQKEDQYIYPKPSRMTVFLGVFISAIGLSSVLFFPASMMSVLLTWVIALCGVVVASGMDMPYINKNKQKYYRHGFDVGCDTDNIYCLQIIEREVKRNTRSFICYELNAVFFDGSRSNILEHADYKSVERSASLLSESLGVDIKKK